MIEINLLPVREERRRQDLQQFAALLGVTLAGSLLVAGLLHLKISNDVGNTDDLIRQTQAQIDQYKPQLEQVEKYRATKESIEKKLEVIDRLDRNRSGPVRVLEELATSSPERLWITRIEANRGRIKIRGMSLDNELVALFLTSLGDSEYFGQVELQETEARDVDGLKLNQFELSAQLITPKRRTPVQPTDTAAARAPGASASR